MKSTKEKRSFAVPYAQIHEVTGTLAGLTKDWGVTQSVNGLQHIPAETPPLALGGFPAPQLVSEQTWHELEVEGEG